MHVGEGPDMEECGRINVSIFFLLCPKGGTWKGAPCCQTTSALGDGGQSFDDAQAPDVGKIIPRVLRLC